MIENSDEFCGEMFRIIEKLETHYMFEKISPILLVQIKSEFVSLFERVEGIGSVDVKLEIDPIDPSGLKLDFYHGGKKLKELEQIYNCLRYNDSEGLRLV